MMPLAEFNGRLDGMIREIKAAPLAKGAERIYLPGEIKLEEGDVAVVGRVVLPRISSRACEVGLRKWGWTRHSST
jgi:hypothetical protein